MINEACGVRNLQSYNYTVGQNYRKITWHHYKTVVKALVFCLKELLFALLSWLSYTFNKNLS